MNEAAFVARFRSDIPIYEAWGDFVTAKISDAVKAAITPRSLEDFLKIPATFRVKDVSSLVDKAFYRNKPYRDPYAEITDKVGVRFVVLLTSEINIIETVVQECVDWTAILDRNYEEEKAKSPTAFTYQSVHLVVVSKRPLVHKEIAIPSGTPCEIQIRTLLQHAYAELNHGWVYKDEDSVKPVVKRTIAKSMALIETADDFFEQVVKTLDAENKPLMDILKGLIKIYRDAVGAAPEVGKSNLLVLLSLKDKLRTDLPDDVRALLEKKPFIPDRIRDASKYQHLFKQPIILLAYYLVSKDPSDAKSIWPLTPDELQPVYDDLGINFEGC